MSIRGRPPKPTALKVLEGNPGKRPLNQNEPKPKPIAPERPSWLTGEAKREWERIVPELERVGLLTMVDGAALANYCQWWAIYVQAAKELKAHLKEHKKLTITYVNTQGAENEVPHPAIAIAEKASKNIKAFCTEFGLTPASRTRMEVKPVDEPDPMEGLLSGVK